MVNSERRQGPRTSDDKMVASAKLLLFDCFIASLLHCFHSFSFLVAGPTFQGEESSAAAADGDGAGPSSAKVIANQPFSPKKFFYC